VTVALLSVSVTASAQRVPQPASEEPFATGSSQWDGYAELTRLAQREVGKELVILAKRINYSELSPQDALIIVRPTQRLNEASLNAFLVEGGRVALLDDYGRSEPFLNNFGIRSLPPPSAPADTLRHNADLPISVPSVQVTANALRGRHPVAAGVERVVTNHPRVFAHPDLTPVLEIVDQNGKAHALAVTGVIAQKGRLFALGDPSVFINFMLRYPDNRKLASGMIRYLTESRAFQIKSPQSDAAPAPSPPKSTGPGRLFILTNDFDELGSYGNSERVQDRFDAALEESWQALKDVGENGLSKSMVLGLSALIAAWIFFSQVQRALRSHRLLAPSYTLSPALAGQVGLASRISVLRSKYANPTLSLLELDAVLRDAVTRRLKQDGGASPARLGELARKAGLNQDDANLLKQTLTEFQVYAQRLTARKRSTASEKELKRLHAQAMHLLNAIETNKMTHRSSP